MPCDCYAKPKTIQSRLVIARGCGVDVWRMNHKGYVVSFCGDEKVLKLDDGTGCTTLNVLKPTEFTL